MFVNQKLYFLLNSLEYHKVYEILVYCLGLARLKPEVYERLLFNLSTFLVFISKKQSQHTSAFFLNHRYQALYPQIVRLVVEHRALLRAVKDKEAFKMVQIMLTRHLPQFSNDDLLALMDILGSPAFLTISLNRHLEELKFTPAQLEHYEHSSHLKAFEYYNKSLLRYF